LRTLVTFLSQTLALLGLIVVYMDLSYWRGEIGDLRGFWKGFGGALEACPAEPLFKKDF
jgi:hypothetical protein